MVWRWLASLAVFLAGAASAQEPSWEQTLAAEPGVCAVLWDLRAGTAHGAGDLAVLDRAVPPGSWMKLFLAYALVGEKVVNRDARFPCAGWSKPDCRCWLRDGHGALDLVCALGASCNAWFAQATVALDPTRFLAAVSLFWPGRLPPWPANPAAQRAWRETFYQGYPGPFAPSLRRLIGAVAALVLDRPVELAGRGRAVAFRFLGEAFPSADREALQVVRDGMSASAEWGTSVLFREAFGKPGVLAKTSSMSRPPREGRRGNDTSCMICGFYPAEAPRAAIFLFVPRGFAASKAAPLAGKAFRDFCLRRKLY